MEYVKNTEFGRRRQLHYSRFYDSHDRKVDGSTPTLVSLRRWIRCFTSVSAGRNVTSSKLVKSEAKLNRKTRKQTQLLSEAGLGICCSASAAFS